MSGWKIVSFSTPTGIERFSGAPGAWLALPLMGPPGPPGPAGPAGPPGSSGATYVHSQAVPLAVWTVNHNLGFRPDVSVFTPGGVEMEAEVAHITATQTEIRFNAATTGTARFV